LKFKKLLLLAVFYCANTLAEPDISLGWGSIYGAGPGAMLSKQSNNYKFFVV
jgi:hypothetical protein